MTDPAVSFVVWKERKKDKRMNEGTEMWLRRKKKCDSTDLAYTFIHERQGRDKSQRLQVPGRCIDEVCDLMHCSLSCRRAMVSNLLGERHWTFAVKEWIEAQARSLHVSVGMTMACVVAAAV